MGIEWEIGREKTKGRERVGKRKREGERDDASWKESYSFSGIHQNSKILFGFPAKIDCRLFVIDLSKTAMEKNIAEKLSGKSILNTKTWNKFFFFPIFFNVFVFLFIYFFKELLCFGIFIFWVVNRKDVQNEVHFLCRTESKRDNAKPFPLDGTCQSIFCSFENNTWFHWKIIYKKKI